MLKNLLTSERYLKHYNKGEKTVVARLNETENVYVVERNEPDLYDLYFDNNPVKILCPDDHYLVGPIAETLHAYEELGYSPEELKKIIEEHKRYDEMHTVTPTPACKTVYRSPKILVERAIFNDPATIVFWKDGTKTVVKAQKGEKYDPEKGLAMAFSKKMFGNEGNYYDQFTKLLPKKNTKK